MSDSSSTSSSDDDIDLHDELANWASSGEIALSSVSKLLRILHVFHPTLPLDARTLLKTKPQTVLQAFSTGEFAYLGVKKQLAEVVKGSAVDFENISEIHLHANIDGMSLHKSTKRQMWPILLQIINISDLSEPFPVAIFCGTSKPDVNEFFAEYVQEINMLQEEGLVINNHHVRVLVKGYICDAPARALVKCVHPYNAKFGCDRCQQEGVWRGRMVYPELESPLRTDSNFYNAINNEHVYRVSPLHATGIGMITGFPLDYMHLVCLGIVKKLLLLWLEGPLTVRFPGSVVVAISQHLCLLQSYFPDEFHRRPRSLSDLKHWKASEFRAFLLYSGVLVLKGKLPQPLYQHFLLLSVAIRILCHPGLATRKEFTDYAGGLLRKFVNDFRILYGLECLVYNVHAVIHLADDVLAHGALDNFSAFPFETCLGSLKRLLKSPKRPLQQLVNRLEEKNVFCKEEVSTARIGVSGEHFSGPSPVYGAQFKRVRLPGCNISIKAPNNLIFINSKVAVIRNIIQSDRIYLVICYFKNQADFFDKPLPSTRIHLFLNSHILPDLHVIHLPDCPQKCVALPSVDNTSYLCVPFPHSHQL
jgi:hypothetical protein